MFKRFFAAFLALCLIATLIVSFVAGTSAPASAHSAGSHGVEVALSKSCKHHLTPGFRHVIDGDIPFYEGLRACHIHRNDSYQVIFSDPCVTLASENALVADNEGRLSFAVILFHCDPDVYVVTLRDISPNHAKYHAVIVVDAA